FVVEHGLWIDAGQLHRDKANQLLASACAAAALKLAPVFVDDGRDLRLHVRAHLLHKSQLLRGQDINELVKVTIRAWQRLSCAIFLCSSGCGSSGGWHFQVSFALVRIESQRCWT